MGDCPLLRKGLRHPDESKLSRLLFFNEKSCKPSYSIPEALSKPLFAGCCDNGAGSGFKGGIGLPYQTDSRQCLHTEASAHVFDHVNSYFLWN